MAKKLTIIMTLVIVAGSGLFSGCQNDAQTGALIGSGIGAGVGAIAGRDSEATLIGAAVGGAAGYLLGNEGDKQKAAADRYQIRQEMDTVLVKVTNSNGSIIQVPLRKQAVGYIGTRGEYYPTMPTSEQLRPVYGF